MKMKIMFIKNFKAFKDVRIDFNSMNCIIGENSSGKTTIIDALRVTFDAHNHIKHRDVIDLDQDVEITIIFDDIDENDRNAFKGFIYDGLITIKWIWNAPSHNKRRISIISKQAKSILLRPWCLTSNEFRVHLGRSRNIKLCGKTIPQHLENTRYEVSTLNRNQWIPIAEKIIKENSTKIRWIDNEFEMDVKKLIDLPILYYMPPIYSIDGIIHANDKRNPITRSISTALDQGRVDLKNKIQNTISRFMDSYVLEGIEEIEDIVLNIAEFQELSITPKMSIEAGPFDSEIQLNLLIDDGVISDLRTKGHGLQRLVIYSQLIGTIKKQERNRISRGKIPKSSILCIEEVELYLHPIFQSIILKQLRIISHTKAMVLFTSHLPNVIDVFELEEIIRVNRKKGISFINQISYNNIAAKINEIIGNNIANATSIQERIGEVLDIETCQALFSRKTIIVEGNTEKYTLPALFKGMGYDFEREGVSIIAVGGKGNIDKFIVLLREFGVPFFVIFDQDKSTKDKSSKNQSDSLRKILGIPVDIDSFLVGDNFCIFEEDFESTIKTLYPIWGNIDIDARNAIGASATAAKSLRARYISRIIAPHIKEGDPSVNSLKSLLELIVEKLKELKG